MSVDGDNFPHYNNKIYHRLKIFSLNMYNLTFWKPMSVLP